MPIEQDERIVAIFKNLSMPDKKASEKEGRPIFRDVEVCEIRVAGNRTSIVVAPAHELWSYVEDADGNSVAKTYADRFPEQYERFKASQAQVQSGTPLEELAAMPQARRMSMKALNIHTIESLAALEGQELKNIGPDGREWKNKALTYLQTANDQSAVATLIAEKEALAARVAELEGNVGSSTGSEQPASPFGQMSVEDLRNWIEDATGETPKGAPNKATLIQMANEINDELAEKAA